MKKEWQEEFHDKLDNYQTPPPKGLFDEILKNLPTNGKEGKAEVLPMETPVTNAGGNSKKQSKVVVWLTSILSAAAMGAILLVNNSIFTTDNHTHISRSLAKSNKSEIKVEGEPTEMALSGNISTTDSGTSPISIMTTNTVNKLFGAIETTFRSMSMTPNVLPQHNSNAPVLAMTEQTISTEQSVEDSLLQETTTDNHKINEKAENREPTHQRSTTTINNYSQHHNKSVQLGILIAGMPTATSSSSLNPITLAGIEDPYGTATTGQNKIIKKVNHHQPVTLGISVAFPLSDRISMETGVTYSHHYSELIYETDNIKHEIKQQLNFVGIPLNLNYRLWKKHNTIIYVTGGGNVEKMVYGKQKERYNDTNDVTTNKVEMNELQWGLAARLGTAYKLSQDVSLYLEPGVTYHFGNNSEVQTIYSDHPLSFQLKAGFRLNLR